MRELTPETITDAVLDQMATTPDPRMKEVMAAAVRLVPKTPARFGWQAEYPFRSHLRRCESSR